VAATVPPAAPIYGIAPRRVAATGAGVQVTGREWSTGMAAIDPATLRDAIATVLEDDAYGAAARQIAQEMESLPPAGDALTVLQHAAA
jgi:UDP:flavonoid glycosyltransferase YjiC (YdhE family)